jgi:hypothetical protein
MKETRLQIWRVAANVWSKQLWTANKGSSTSIVDGRGLTASDLKNQTNFETRRDSCRNEHVRNRVKMCEVLMNLSGLAM